MTPGPSQPKYVLLLGGATAIVIALAFATMAAAVDSGVTATSPLSTTAIEAPAVVATTATAIPTVAQAAPILRERRTVTLAAVGDVMLGRTVASASTAAHPAGRFDRFADRFGKRVYRWSTTSDGLPAAHIVFDDEGGAWFRSLMDAALSPRRGGPRFVAEGEKKQAEELVADPRSNDQLAYDLFLDLLRAGALANVKDVFGAKEAGVRLVTLTDTVTGERTHRVRVAGLEVFLERFGA